MTQKILIHTNGNRKYRSLIRHISNATYNKNNLILQNVHNRLFDISYITKPNILILPIVEYTQEIHNYIEENNDTKKIILYIDLEINQQQLKHFLNSSSRCHFICENGYEQDLRDPMILNNFYDDNIYKILPNTKRNDKVAIALSEDNDKNSNILKDILYPNPNKYKVVLFNNPEFKHSQNIGIYNEPDLNYILNTFSYFVDMDKQFILEAQATHIKYIDSSSSILEELDKQKNTTTQSEIPETAKCSHIVQNIIMPFLGI